MQKCVAIIDDDPSTCRALQRLLEVAGFSTTVFGSARAFLQNGELDEPDCILLDVHMPDLDGFDLQEKLNVNQSRSPIVFLTGRGDVPMSVRAMQSGASDFLLKPVDEEDLVSAINRAMARPDKDLDANALQRLEKLKSLTAREREVLDEILKGALNKQIANTLQIAERTVKMHRSRVMHKLRAESVLDLAPYRDL